MFLRWIGLSLRSIAALKPLVDVAAKEGSPALSDKLQRVREEATEARSHRKARERGAVRQVVDPVLAALSADDWAKVRALLATMTDHQLRLLGDAVLESHDEVSVRGGPDAGLELSALVAGEIDTREAQADARRRAEKDVRPPGRWSKARNRRRRRGASESDGPGAMSDVEVDVVDGPSRTEPSLASAAVPPGPAPSAQTPSGDPVGLAMDGTPRHGRPRGSVDPTAQGVAHSQPPVRSDSGS